MELLVGITARSTLASRDVAAAAQDLPGNDLRPRLDGRDQGTIALECAVTSRLDCLVAPCQTLSAIDHDLSTASGCVLAVSCSPLLSVCSLQVISSFAIRSVASVSHRNHASQSFLTHCFQPLDLTTFLVSHSVMQMNILCR